jgi:two-component system chemotaxis sensor kinase CheA
VVLDVPQLLRSAREGSKASALPATDDVSKPAPYRILVAEDSITSRMLVKATLETAGYRVVTAVDGMDAWARLRSQAFDLLVSDVEMPRLDGFALTTRLRADPATAQLPVVLVTSLEKTEDRDKGLDCGADAYVVKSSFDQDKLLDTVRRLIGRAVA